MGIANVLLLAQSRHAQCADECLPLGARQTLTNRCLPISIMGTQPSLASISGPRACFLRLSRTLREPGCRFFQGGTVRWK
jgi:hypothetical protein